MIQKLSHYSEKYTPHGNVAAEGILNQLGRPGLDLLSILVRETVQNSWDARLSDETTVQFTIAERRLSATQLDFLHHAVLAEEPEQLKLHAALSAATADGIHVLTISDRGTVGLNGPIRADAPDDESRSRNFANFFFNVGQTKEHQLSGGTYGYGKSILYRASQLHTICVYTRCKAAGRHESRFMAAALQPHEEKGAGYRRYTGRHWWGYQNPQDGILDPVIGPAADELALELGVPLFNGDETGTTCMILLPVLGDCSFIEAMQRISRLLLWYCWPKMLIRPDGKVPMQFALYYDEQPVLIPDPCGYPPLNGFVEAMKLLKTSPAGTQDSLCKVVSIDSRRPKRHLGQLALIRFWEEGNKDTIAGESEFVPPISSNSHHVALMRHTELVVKYLEGDQLPISKLAYAGVFIAATDVDAAFAKAEPPTHDDWNTKSMTEKEEKSIVNVALHNIHGELKDFVTPPTTSGRDEELVPLGDFADQLGNMLIGVGGNAAYAEPIEERNWNRSGKRSATNANGRGPGVKGSSSLFDIPDSSTIDNGQNGEHTSPVKPDPEDHSNGGNNIAGSGFSHFEKNRTGQRPTSGTTTSKEDNNGGNGTTSTTDRVRDGQQSTTGAKSHDGDRDSSSGTDPFSSEEMNPGESGSQEGTSTGTRSRAKIEPLDQGQLNLLRDIPVMLTSFRVKHALHAKSTIVEVEAGVVLDNGEEESEPPLNKARPEILLWVDSAGKERSGNEAVLVPATDNGIWQVAVTVPDDAKLQINLTAREVF